MKRLLTFLTVITLIISMTVSLTLPANAETTGTTGDCTWELEGTVLTVSGNGPMGNYYNTLTLTVGSTPWGTSLTKVIIEEGVTTVGMAAFANCKELKEVSLPKSLTSIEKFGFFRCKNLPAITLPKNLALIGANAFYEDAKLASIIIPDSVIEIGNDAFEDCKLIKNITIPHTVTNIGSDAFLTNWFYDSSSAKLYVHEDSAGHLYALENPNSYVLTKHTYETHRCTVCNHVEPGFEVFSGSTGDCTWSLDNVNLTLTISGNGRMADYLRETVQPWGRAIKSVVIEEGVTGIGNSAFYKCVDLTSVSMADTVTDIGEYAFSKCAALSELNLSKSLRSIADYVFESCSSLPSLTIPPSLLKIGSNTFSYCYRLSGVYITDLTAWCRINFASLEANPLYYGHNLYLNGELLTELVIPEEITEIKQHAFSDCASLHNLYFHEGVTKVGDRAFYDCTKLRNIRFKPGLTFIGDSAFRNDNMNFMTLPEGLLHIGSQAFAANESLTLTNIPASVTYVGDLAFETDWLNRDDAKLYVHEDTAGHTYALNNNNRIYHLITHTPDGADTVIKATCALEGSRTNHCSVCNLDYTRVIPMLAHTPVLTEEGALLCSACGTSTIEDGRYTINKVSYLIKDGKFLDGETADWGETKDLFIIKGRPAAAGVYTYDGENLYVTSSHKLANGVHTVSNVESAEALGILSGKAYLFEEGRLVDGKTATWSDGKEYRIIMGRPALGGVFEIDGKMVYHLSDGTPANGVWKITDEVACEKLGIAVGLPCLFEKGEVVHGKEAAWTNGVSYFMSHGRPFNRGITYVSGEPVYVIGYHLANGVWKLNGEEGAELSAALGIANDLAYLFEEGKLVDGKTATWANGKEYLIVKGRPQL